jgi:hypothetical protein
MLKLLFTTHSFHKDVIDACSEELVDSLDEFTKTWLRQVALYIPETETKILHGLDAALTSMLATAPMRRKKALNRLLDTIAPALAKSPVEAAPAPQAAASVETPVEEVDPLAPLPDEVEDEEEEPEVDPQQIMQDELIQELDALPECAPIQKDAPASESTFAKKYFQKKKTKKKAKPKLVIPKVRAQGLLAQLYRDIKKGKK